MLIDLQLHSINSDGYLNPTEVAELCHQRGLKVASLTDHNTVSGQEEFNRACKQFKIKAIPGMELYVKLKNKHLNLLWYNFDIDNPELHKILRETQNRRRSSARKVLEKLKKKGYMIDVDAVVDKHNHYMPINRVVDSFRNLNKKKIQQEFGRTHVTSTEIVKHYFRSSSKVRLHESYINIERIFRLRKKVGGQLILCHPCKFHWIDRDILKKLTKMGLDGVEVLSPHHSWNAISYLQALADQYKLIMTGGSDFHLFERDKYFKIKSSWDYFTIDSKMLKDVSKIIN